MRYQNLTRKKSALENKGEQTLPEQNRGTLPKGPKLNTCVAYIKESKNLRNNNDDDEHICLKTRMLTGNRSTGAHHKMLGSLYLPASASRIQRQEPLDALALIAVHLERCLVRGERVVRAVERSLIPVTRKVHQCEPTPRPDRGPWAHSPVELSLDPSFAQDALVREAVVPQGIGSHDLDVSGGKARV